MTSLSSASSKEFLRNNLSTFKVIKQLHWRPVYDQAYRFSFAPTLKKAKIFQKSYFCSMFVFSVSQLYSQIIPCNCQSNPTIWDFTWFSFSGLLTSLTFDLLEQSTSVLLSVKSFQYTNISPWFPESKIKKVAPQNSLSNSSLLWKTCFL